MATEKQFGRLHDAIENYYQYNPDTLMPLLMLALAAQGKLQITHKQKKATYVACSLSTEEIQNYEWVKLDETLNKDVEEWLKNGVLQLNVEMDLGRSLLPIYETFLRNDTKDVVQEHHHRMGRLVQHSNNAASEKAHRQYATYILADAMINYPKKDLKKEYLDIFNYVLDKSDVQPERPRIKVARTLAALLQYDGVGLVYNPFAGCSIAGAMLRSKNNFYGDGDSNDKLYAAGLLLNYGMGVSNEHFIQRDSTQWLEDKKIDYVLSTYTGYIKGNTAFDFCLGKCLEDKNFTGKYAGMVMPREIFDKRTANFTEALKRDWIDTIVLMPFGEVAVLVDANKSIEMRSKVKFFDLTHPMLRNRPISMVLTDDNYADILCVSDVTKDGYLSSLVVPEFEEREGYEIITLSSIVKKLERRTYSLENVHEDEQVLAYIDKSNPYDKYASPWMNGIDKKRISYLFAPAYHLTNYSLITNKMGALEPRIFDIDLGSAYFQEGYAFEFYHPIDEQWLMRELNAPYVLRQLHPYGMDKMVPGAITEEQILNLKVYRDVEGYCDGVELPNGQNPDADKLPMGYDNLKGKNCVYTIHRFLGHGYFGYTYSAESKNLVTGEVKEVVLKEFYPWRFYRREGVKAILDDESQFMFVEDAKTKFLEEAKLMNLLGLTPDSHIVPAFEYFENEETDTMYYVMPFYNDGSLEDLQNSGFTFNEDMVLKHVVVPLCKALHIANNSKVLHLDIKPENILVDSDGDAVLIDFGVAKQYDGEGDIIDPCGATSGSMFAAPELKHGNMVKFGAQTDIYGLASSIYYLLASPEVPHPIFDFSDQDRDLRDNLKDAKCSDAFINAIIAGLQFSATSRPANAQAFLNLFPGCENIKL